MVASVIDITDPYSAAAMYNCFLICEGCGNEPVVERPAHYDLAHYQRTGQAAKAQGWFVAPIEGEEAAFQIYCAACASERRLAPSLNLRFAPTEAILAVAELASGSAPDVTPNTSLERTRER